MPSFRGVLNFATGTGSNARAYIFNRDGAGKFGLNASPKVQMDTSQGYIQINAGAFYHLQFAIDTGATGLGQSNFGTLSSTGGESLSNGILEITLDNGAQQLFIVKTGYAFFNGTDKIFLTLNTYPPRNA